MRAVLAAVLALTSCGVALAQERGPPPSINAAAPPSAMEQAPRLPVGPLERLDASSFLVLSDLSRRSPGFVEATVFTVLRSGRPAMLVSRQAIDCSHRTVATYDAWYGADGMLLDAARNFEPRPLQPATTSSSLATRVCSETAPGQTYPDYKAALAAPQ